MATSQRQDVELGLAVNVTNAERIDSLTKDLKQLAAQGSITAQDFERLTNELKQIGTQGSTVETLSKIESELTQTSGALAQATAKAEALGSTLAEQTAKTKAFSDAQQKVAAELRDTKEKLIEAQRQLDLLNNQYDRAGKATLAYLTPAKQLKDAIAELEAKQAKQTLALKDADKALRDSNKELKAANDAATQAAKAADTLAKKAAEQSQELTKAKEAVAALGVASESAAIAEQALANAIDKVNAETAQAAAAAEKRAAIEKAVAESNARNVELARKAADARAAADEQARARADALTVALNKLAYANDAVAASEAQAAQNAKLAGEAIQQALGTVGVRSAQAIRAEINQIKDSMGTLRQSGELTGKALEDAARKAAARVNELELELRQVTNQLTLADRAKLGFNALAEGANNLIGRFGALGAAVGTVVFALKPFFDTAIQFDSLRRSLTAVTGSVAEAEKLIGFLRETANRAGVSVASISEAFVRFNASARASGISAQVVKDVFANTAIAAGNLGISSDKLTLILDALAQMANKGVVSMEELRQQLGDSLPGALSLLAKGLGLTESELVKLVESGKVLTVDALPALADALVSLAPKGGQVEGLSASFNRLKNAITETTQAATQGSGFSGLVAVMKLLGAAVLGAYTGLAQLVEVMVLGVTTVYRFGQSITTFSTGPLKQLADESSAARERIRNLGGVFASYVTSTQKATESTTQAGDAITQAGQQAAGAAAGHTANANAQGVAAGAASANASAQSGSGAAAVGAGTQASNASGGWYALQLAIEKTTHEQEKAILNAETYAKAAKIEGDTRKLLAQLAGDEANAVRVAAEASALEAQRLAEVARIRQQGLEVLTRERDELIAEAARLGTANKQREEQIKKLNELIAARQAESEKANQSAEAARLETLARETAAKTYADNSAKLEMLRQVYIQTTQAVSALEAALKSGTATQGQVDAAREKAAAAEALYRDAVKDSAAAIERKTALVKATVAAEDAGINAKKSAIDTEIAMRTALNDTGAVYQLQLEKKKLDIQLTTDKVRIAQVELDADRQKLEQDRQALKLNDPLLAQKQQDLAIREQSLKQKQNEINATKELIKQQQIELDVASRKSAVVLGASNDAVAGIEREIAAQERLNAVKEKAIELENKRRNVDANGFSLDKTGKQTVNALGDTYLSILGQLKSYGLNDAQAAQVAREFTDSNGNVPYYNNPGQLKYGGPNGGTLSYAVQQAASKLLFESAGMAPAPAPAPRPNAVPSPAPAPAQSSGGSYTVNVNLGGQSTVINTASQADAQKLISLMQTISSRTAG